MWLTDMQYSTFNISSVFCCISSALCNSVRECCLLEWDACTGSYAHQSVFIWYVVASGTYLCNRHFIFRVYSVFLPVPMAARSKAQVCSRSPAEIVGSNYTRSMEVCLLYVLCVIRQRSLRLADHSSRGVLPSVVRRRVWSRNLVNEKALPHWGLSRQKQTN